ncbi:MAG TPA: hypothetical protein VEF34_12350, partial [Syntrophobacteraceae bacterium]|nr:hypothetical protein [Syntrophobacteraceae bacterium]
VTANHTISATFTQTTYTISASAGTGGSISPAGSQAVPFGTNQSFTIAPAANYKISSLHVDGKPIPASSTYTFSYVAANHRIAAHFEPLEYFISSASNSGGSISPSGTTKVRAGRNVTYTITSAKHHKLSDVLIDGKSFSLVSCGTLTREVSGATSGDAYTYSFTDVSADHTIQAVFLNIPPPVADPGPDQDVESGSIVKLDGVNSTDFLSGIASYKWTQTAGPPVNLSCPLAGPECTFNAPGTSHGACLVFKLQVTNKAGLTSSALCLVNVSTVDKAPLANAGASRSVHPYDIVNLDGSRSSDPEGRIASYTWTQVHGPAVEIHNADTHTATFVAPDPGPAGVSLVFTLWVKDNFGLTTRDWVTINVVRDDEPPVANAGPNQTAAATAAVTLYGSRSLDPEVHWTDIYRWKQISGVPVKLSDPTAVNPTFFAPADTTGAQSDNLVFRLTVTDAQDGLRSISKCSVTVQNR